MRAGTGIDAAQLGRREGYTFAIAVYGVGKVFGRGTRNDLLGDQIEVGRAILLGRHCMRREQCGDDIHALFAPEAARRAQHAQLRVKI